MTDKDLIIKLISHDFSVELFERKDDSVLFGAMRPDVWHFLRRDKGEEEKGEANNIIAQRHITRYEIARDVEQLLKANRLRDDDVLFGAPLCVNSRGLFIRSDQRFDIDLMITEHGLKNSISKKLKHDLPILKRARKRIKQRNGLFYLPRVKSFKKHPVADRSYRLIEAIAFEREQRGRLNARKFGIYSAFCTWRDFCVGATASREELEGHVSSLFEYDPSEVSEEFRVISKNVQESLFSKPIWGVGINVDVEDAIEIVGETMAALNSVQRAQFCLMNGLHHAGLILPLAIVTSVISFKKYAQLMTATFQPDSEAEQLLRTELAFIDLLGEISNSGDVADWAENQI